MQRIKYLLAGCILIFSAWSCKKNEVSQPASFNKVFGGSKSDNANGIIKSGDGGYIVVGGTESNDQDLSGNHGLTDFWVFKLDANGNKVWQRALGGSSYEGANAVVASSDGGYVIAGFTESNDGDVTGHHGPKFPNYDEWIVKIDKNGNLLWQTTLGGSAIDNALSIINSADGGYIVVGYTQSSDGDVSQFKGSVDSWIVKLNGQGTKVWAKTFGGSGEDFTTGITAIPSGGYLVAGETTSNDGDVSGNHGAQDAWLLAIDENGNKMWQKTYGGTGYDYARYVCVSSDGGYGVAGITYSNDGDVSGNHGTTDIWAFKTDNAGKLLWQRALGGSGGETPQSIITTPDAGFAIVGATSSNNGDVTSSHPNTGEAWLVTLDAKGALLTSKTMGGSGSENADGIVGVKGNTVAIAGYTDSADGDVGGTHGGVDAWVFTTQLK